MRGGPSSQSSTLVRQMHPFLPPAWHQVCVGVTFSLSMWVLLVALKGPKPLSLLEMRLLHFDECFFFKIHAHIALSVTHPCLFLTCVRLFTAVQGVVTQRRR